MRILGINEGIDASVVLCDDGRILWAVQEERVNRQKGYIGFPSRALALCVRQFKLEPGNVDHVCFSNLSSPYSETRADLVRYYLRNAQPIGELVAAGDLGHISRRLASALPGPLLAKVSRWRWRRRGSRGNESVERSLSQFGLSGCKVSRFHHHSNHAASAYYGLWKNPEEAHIVLTLDGGGDDACAQVYLAKQGRLELLAQTPNGHSIGNIYACATFMLGMKPHEHEYKLMGLAPYPDQHYGAELVQKFRGYLDLDPEDPLRFKRKVPEPTHMILPRMMADFRFVRFDNLAGALQSYTEDLLSRWVAAAVEKTGIPNLLAAGGVFMNVKANKRIAELPGIEYFDVFPSCGDETLPFGAVWQCYVDNGGDLRRIGFDDIYLGPDASADLPEARAKYQGLVNFERVDDPELTAARLLAEGKIVGRCSGRMEFGARALGNRSILADPSRHEVVKVINQMIKQRDFWMPFAPAMLAEKADEYIQVPAPLAKRRISPYMMHTFDTTGRRQEFVAGIHMADQTARAQVVWENLNPGFHKLISHFGAMTGRWVVLNTSFNLHGHPIVGGACDAVDVMLKSDLDFLMIDDHLVTKK